MVGGCEASRISQIHPFGPFRYETKSTPGSWGCGLPTCFISALGPPKSCSRHPALHRCLFTHTIRPCYLVMNSDYCVDQSDADLLNRNGFAEKSPILSIWCNWTPFLGGRTTTCRSIQWCVHAVCPDSSTSLSFQTITSSVRRHHVVVIIFCP